MNVKIHSVDGHGNASEEVVWLQVMSNCDIGTYLLSDSTYTPDGKISNKLRHIYWFPDQQMQAGDFVALFTGIGTNTSFKNEHNTSTYYFFWNLKSAVWNDEGDTAVLIEAKDWEFKKSK